MQMLCLTSTAMNNDTIFTCENKFPNAANERSLNLHEFSDQWRWAIIHFIYLEIRKTWSIVEEIWILV